MLCESEREREREKGGGDAVVLRRDGEWMGLAFFVVALLITYFFCF
jgi:hypothetical protein